jgi:hypothetical protein
MCAMRVTCRLRMADWQVSLLSCGELHESVRRRDDDTIDGDQNEPLTHPGRWPVFTRVRTHLRCDRVLSEMRVRAQPTLVERLLATASVTPLIDAASSNDVRTHRDDLSLCNLECVSV